MKRTKKSMKPGGGGRFQKLEGKLEKKYGKKSARKIAASIGRKKYGKKGMAKMAAKGRARRSAHSVRR
jgi:hypothetical protein